MKRYSDSQSSELQESFVLSVLDEKRNGYYVELGAHDAYDGSNTFLLDERFGWTGLSLELDAQRVEKWNTTSSRNNKCVEGDALLFDYRSYFEENNFPKRIDYLSVDIDEHDKGQCLLALLALPMLHYRFSVITLEHDMIEDYRREGMRAAQRQILSFLGYQLVGQIDSEDWWLDGTCPEFLDGEGLFTTNERFITFPHLRDDDEE